ncbi:uncharacterized protein pink [Planococcus citri]|uniref:uncharacterized protein pink n=1 Tax=Planococcus citri TaxID=170843 RepID=UPI0031F9E35A
MAVNQKQEVILLHTENHKNTFYLPLKRSERIKYTCFTVSKNYIVFGATSGGLYAFKRNPCSFWQLIPSKESAVTHVSISSSENFIAFSTNKGILCILELNEINCGKLVIRSDDLSDSEISTLCWTDDNNKPTLYVGDSTGRVSFLKLSFLSKNILHLPTTIFMTLDSKIIQLCWLSDFLLVSTLSRCYLCDTVKEQFKQIGHQLRDGMYGACFTKNANNIRIFCARPGSRLWEVNLDAVVHSTHQFKQQLAIPPSSFISVYEEPRIIGKEQNKTEWSAQSFNFIKLYDLLGRYIFTYKKDGIYILNVDMANILFWSNFFTDIVDVQCISNNIFLWTAQGDLHELVLLPVEKCLLSLYLKKQYSLCVDVICSHFDRLTQEEPLATLHPLRDFEYPEIDSEKCEIFQNFKQKLKSIPIQGVELSSGIYMVNNAHLSSRLLDDNRLQSTHKHRSLNRCDSEESRQRSHSLPSNLKKTHENDTKSSTFTISSFAQDLQASENLYLEMGLYSSPYLTLASYEILQDSFAELGASFSEKFTESSKHLKEKWQLFENKLNSLRNKKPDENNLLRDRLMSQYGDMKGDRTDDDDEPIVEVRKKKTVQVEFDFSQIIDKCNEIDENSPDVDSDKVINLLNTIIEEFFKVSERLGFDVNSSYSCFPFNSMPDKEVVKLKKVFKTFFAKNNLLDWFDSRSFPLQIDNVNWVEKHPSLLRQIFTADDLKLDYLLSKVLAIFSELLNVSSILEMIKSFELSCYYLSFCYIIKYYQNGDVRLERNNHTKTKNNQWPLPVYLNAMLLMISVDQWEAFYEMGLKNNIDACDVAYMMLHLEANIMDSGDKYKEICLTYIQRLCLKDTSCLKNISIVYLAIKLFVYLNEKFESCCASCWFLLPQQTCRVKFLPLGHLLMAHIWSIFEDQYLSVTHSNVTKQLLPYESLLFFERLVNEREYEPLSNICYKNADKCVHAVCENLKTYVQDISADNLRSLLLLFHLICSLCHRIPELWKYLPSLQRNSKLKLFHVQHFLQLGMIEEIESYFEILTVEDAQKILTMNASLGNGICLNCGSKMPSCGILSWNKLAVFILKRINVRNTLKILSEFSENIQLDKSFYRSAILTSVPGIGNELRDQVLASVGDHFDVNRVSLDVHEQLSEALKKDKLEKALKIRPSNANHWGISINVDDTNQAICYCCSLPLFSQSLIKEDNGGIMVFSCNHTYHTVCLKNKDCTAICLVCDRFLR